MVLIKIKVEYQGSNKVLNLDRSKANMYQRLMMELEMKIEEPIMLFYGVVIISDENSLLAAIEDCVNNREPFLQLVARPDKSSKSISVPTTPAKPPVTEQKPSQPPAVEQKQPSQPVSTVSPSSKPSSTLSTPAKSGSGQKFCMNCGAALNGGKFCMNCGEKVVQNEEPKPAPKEEPKPTPKEEPKPTPKEEPKPIPKEEPKPTPKEEPKPKFVPPKPNDYPKIVTERHDQEHCGRCGEAIQTGILALDRIWHKDCFKCVQCGEPFEGEKKLMEHEDGNPICSDCYREYFIPRCSACGKPLDGQYVSINDEKYHPQCFVCTNCGAQIQGSYMLKNGQVVCKNCA